MSVEYDDTELAKLADEKIRTFIPMHRVKPASSIT